MSASKDLSRQIERLGHELQHAVEVEGRSWVTDDRQLQRMLVMTGWADSPTMKLAGSLVGPLANAVDAEVAGIALLGSPS